MISTAMLIEEDCTVLLERALLGKEVCAFGEDGGGKHGTQPFGHFYRIKTLDICITADDEDDPTDIVGDVAIVLEGYNSDKVGHIMTDQNFLISLGAHLKTAVIDPAALEWHADESQQGRDSVVMRINLELLLDWA